MSDRTEDAQWGALKNAINRHFNDPRPVRVKDRSRNRTRAFGDPTADRAIANADRELAARADRSRR